MGNRRFVSSNARMNPIRGKDDNFLERIRKNRSGVKRGRDSHNTREQSGYRVTELCTGWNEKSATVLNTKQELSLGKILRLTQLQRRPWKTLPRRKKVHCELNIVKSLQHRKRLSKLVTKVSDWISWGRYSLGFRKVRIRAKTIFYWGLASFIEEKRCRRDGIR